MLDYTAGEALCSLGAVHASPGEAYAGVDEVPIDEVGGENLQLVAMALGNHPGDEQPREPVDPSCHRLDGERRQVVAHGRAGVLHPVEEPPLGHRRIVAQIPEVAIELCPGHVRVDPVIPEVPRAPQKVAGVGRRLLDVISRPDPKIGANLL